MRVLIVGCGYLGLALGSELVRQGQEVWGLRRNTEDVADLHAAGVRPITGDITKPADLGNLPAPFDWVVNAVSSDKGGVEEYRTVYLQGTKNLLTWLAEMPLLKYVAVSSTSVYGQKDGSLVKENSLTDPESDTSQILVATERLLLKSFHSQKFPAVILRAAGIYGPGRGHLFLQYLENQARISGKGDRLINMIHRDDLAGIILAALKSGIPGEIYNAVDDEPVAQIHFFRWLSETLGKNMPPFTTAEEDLRRKRGLTQKKVSNRKVKMELGYRFKYPTFRQGYTAEIQRLDRAGLLNIELEPR